MEDGECVPAVVGEGRESREVVLLVGLGGSVTRCWKEAIIGGLCLGVETGGMGIVDGAVGMISM